MADDLWNLPELTGTGQFVRIPAEQDVPLTDRVRAIIDTPAMQRLKQISQLGLVSSVYPGAVHSRFEHSLGVYRLACQTLLHLARAEPRLLTTLDQSDVQCFLLASLLHDVGHWPYCHPIEDMRLSEIQRHEENARRWITEGEVPDVIQSLWKIDPGLVADFLTQPANQPKIQILQNILNGPVDVDKMDYLQRDSLHSGVPYGRNFDVARLLAAFRIGPENRLAISSKGKTAAEMMVFSRYVMFSEVYWHHSVRAATAMLQRLVFRLRDFWGKHDWLNMTDAQFQQTLLTVSVGRTGPDHLANSLFGRERRLFKRIAQYNVALAPAVHAALAHRPYEQLVQCSDKLAQLLAHHLNISVGPDQILIDAPPVKLEIQFRLSILHETGVQSLSDISPVVRALATDQFDKFVKQVRVYAHPQLREQIKIDDAQLQTLLIQCSTC